jgi:hypothetical protein
MTKQPDSHTTPTREDDVKLLRLAAEQYDDILFDRAAYKNQKADPNSNPTQDALERILNGKY